MTFVLTATKVLNILSKTLKDAVSGFFEFYSLREGGGLLKKSWIRLGILFGLCIFHRSCDSGARFLREVIYPRKPGCLGKVFLGSGGLFFRLLLHLWYEKNGYIGIDPNHGALRGIMGA